MNQESRKTGKQRRSVENAFGAADEHKVPFHTLVPRQQGTTRLNRITAVNLLKSALAGTLVVRASVKHYLAFG